MKKVVFKRILKALSVIIPIILILSFCQENLFCLNKKPTWRAKGFYLEDNDTIDVALIGASEIFVGFSAGLAYEEYGFTSYPWAYDDAPVSLWKSQLIEMRKTQNPQMYVIEVNGALGEGEDYLYDDGVIRRYVDNIPLSLNKLQTLSELRLKDDYFSYLFPFIKYHGNLSNSYKVLKENIYYKKQGYTLLKGFQTKTKFDTEYEEYPYEKYKSIPLEEPSKECLIDFLEYCKDNSISNIVFTRFPHRIFSEKKANKYYRSQDLKKIVNEYGFDYIDLESDYQLADVDLRSDMYDFDHLNIYGARKVTSYLGKVLVEKYGVKNGGMSESKREEWNNCVKYTELTFDYVERMHLKGADEMVAENSKFLAKLQE